MFFKKNKKNDTPKDMLPQQTLPTGGGSLFAPGLNPSPSHLNANYITSPIESEHHGPTEVLDTPSSVITPPPLHWESEESALDSLDITSRFAHEATEVIAEPIDASNSLDFYSTITPVDRIDQAMTSNTMQPIETFASGIPSNAPWDTNATLEQEAMALEEFPPIPQELYQQDLPSVGYATVSESQQTDWIDQALHSGTMDSLLSENTLEQTTEQVYETSGSRWDMTTAEPLEPGIFLDTVNQQLYPEDPFLDPMSALEGAQAFEDAAPFLFPETVSASPDWQDDTIPLKDFASLPPLSTELNPIDLGPSYQPEPSHISDLSATVTEEPNLNTFIEPTTVSGFESAESNLWEQSPTEKAPDFGLPPLESISAPTKAASNSALLETFSNNDEGPDLPISDELSAAFNDAYNYSVDIETTEEVNLWASEPESFSSLSNTISADTTTNYFPEDNWLDEAQAVTLDETADLLPPVEGPLETAAGKQDTTHILLPDTLNPNSLDAFLSDDEDFYASSFTLTEQGDVLPSYDAAASQTIEIETVPTKLKVREQPTLDAAFEEEVVSQQPSTQEPNLVKPLDEDIQLTPWEETDTQLSTETPAPFESLQPSAEDSIQEYPPAPEFAAEHPHTEEATFEPDSAEALWNTAASIEAPVTSVDPAQPIISYDNLEVLGVCQLTPDKRLLLVQSDQHIALMGQAGMENPQVTVLKIFDSNPIAYQNTFAAAQEGQAGEQGMFVTQVGTWHAIISTFRNQIALHTELG